ncbi:MAG: hypothetical protein PHV77_05310 [Candidatus Omnitrophica bacterium]|jgi:hypothetical protein|nr:hypothetical protein [Candidatus Omnitrophota bacterium]
MRRKNRAFLLIETLIAVALVSSSVILINHAFSSSLKAVSLANSYYEAAMFLDERIFDMDLKLYTQDSLDIEQEEVFLQTAFIFRSQVMALEKDDLDYGHSAQDTAIKRLCCELDWSKDGDRRIGLVSYVPAEGGEGFSY